MHRTKKDSRSAAIRSELRSLKDDEKAGIFSSFFKTGPGEYGEGDRFLGIPAPKVRRIVKKYRKASVADILELLHSVYHEERLTALLIMVDQYQKGNAEQKTEIFSLYLENTGCINSWDLVDLTAPHIVGEQLFRKKKSLLTDLARSENIWERRIAILSTFYFIRRGTSRETLRIARILLNDSHDLIHKAVGWMLREVGKRCSLESECRFLEKYASVMPRTMLRYAVELFTEDLRMYYMKKKSEAVGE